MKAQNKYKYNTIKYDMHECNLIKRQTTTETMATMIKEQKVMIIQTSKHNVHKINACSTSTKRCNGSNQTTISDLIPF